MKKYILVFVLFFALAANIFANPAKESEVYLNFLHGVVYDLDGQDAKALSFYEAALKSAPDSEYLKIKILESALRIKKQKDYAEIAEQVASYKDNPDALAVYASYSWAEGNLQHAMQYYKLAMEAAPDNAMLKLEYITLLKAVDINMAISFLSDYAKNTPNVSPAIYHDIGILYLEKNNIPAALSSFNKATEISPEFSLPYITRAEIYKKQNNFAAALKEYRTLEKLGAQSPALYNNMGTVSILINDIPAAKGYFEKSLIFEPSNVMANKFMATISEDEGNYEAGLAYLKASADFNEDTSKQLQASFFATKLGKKEDASAFLNKAYQTSNGSVEIGYFYAISLQDLNKHKDAAAVFKEILNVNPDYERARFMYALSLYELKKYKEVEKQMHMIIAKNPENAEALNSLGYSMLMQNKKIDQAGEYIKKALAIMPDSFAITDSLGWFYYKKKDYGKALELTTGAYAQAQGDAEIAGHLGMIYYQVEDWENAVKYLQINGGKEYQKYLKKAQKNLRGK